MFKLNSWLCPLISPLEWKLYKFKETWWFLKSALLLLRFINLNTFYSLSSTHKSRHHHNLILTWRNLSSIISRLNQVILLINASTVPHTKHEPSFSLIAFLKSLHPVSTFFFILCIIKWRHFNQSYSSFNELLVIDLLYYLHLHLSKTKPDYRRNLESESIHLIDFWWHFISFFFLKKKTPCLSGWQVLEKALHQWSRYETWMCTVCDFLDELQRIAFENHAADHRKAILSQFCWGCDRWKIGWFLDTFPHHHTRAWLCPLRILVNFKAHEVSIVEL